MSEAARRSEHWTLERFLAHDDGTDTRHELHDGELVAMAPVSGSHSMLVGQLGVTIGGRLRRPCRVATEVGVIPPHRLDTYYEADLVVTCAPLGPDGMIVEPVVVVEVLSPSTAASDVLRKLPDYREMASVEDILLVSSTERRIEHWHREADGWKVRAVRDAGTVRLQAIEVVIELETLYEGLVAAPAAAAGGAA